MRTRRWLAVGATVVVAAGVAVAATAMLRSAEPKPPVTHAASATPSRTPSPSPTATPPPTPKHVGPAANTGSYDVTGLPPINVFSVNPAVPVDTNPGGPMTDLVAYAAHPAVPVFGTPSGAPVAKLEQSPKEGGAAVPVIAEYSDWVAVLLSGRHALPPGGNSHQTYGWLRRADVALTHNDTHIVITLSKHTIQLVKGKSTTTVSTDFAWGTSATPTPIGRTFVMEVAVNPALGYTRGHPIVYLATQSPTLVGFDGGSVAVTAIHYHDVHSGAISNGCIRVDARAIDTLNKVPAGTVVYIRQ
jgi:hypothetical protein